MTTGMAGGAEGSSAPRPISVLLCSMPAEGHIGPMTSVARHLVQRGWRVRMLTGREFEPAVTASGAAFLPLPDRTGPRRWERGVAPKGIAAMNEGLKTAFFDPAPAAWDALRSAVEAEPTDAVLHETTFLAATGLRSMPPESRPLSVMCGIVPLGLSSRDTAPFGLGVAPMPGPIGRLRNRMLTRLARRVILAPVHRQADRMLRELGAPGLTEGFFIDVLARADVLAQFTVPQFEYPRSDAPPQLHFIGPIARLSPSRAALPPWWDRLDGSRPVVHVSQGTVANNDFTELIAPTLAGLAAEPVTVVVSTGGRPVSELPPLPANALAAEFLPYDRLFARVDVFVTNGGYGGLHFAMEHGTAIVVAGDTEDKVETSARVAWSGVGVNLRTGRPTPRAIRSAVRTVLADDRYAQRSAEIGAAIMRSPGMAGLASLVESELAR
jgi:UDP:flavonoid glycosyltransferase YjiC (YdhE family)